MKINQLFESKSAPLYHGTNVFSMISIIYSNVLKASAFWNKPNEKHGIRMSRNYHIAKTFINNTNPDLEEYEGGVLALDQLKISNNYKIKPYHDTQYEGGDFGDEMEEIIVTEKITNLDNYLLWFMLSDDVIDFACSDEGWEIYQNWQSGLFKNKEDLIQQAKYVKNHKKRRSLEKNI